MTIVAPPAPPIFKPRYYLSKRPVHFMVRDALVKFRQYGDNWVYSTDNPRIAARIDRCVAEKLYGMHVSTKNEYDQIVLSKSTPELKPSIKPRELIAAQSATKLPNTCIIQLGRIGDIINILPVAKWIFDTTRHKPAIMSGPEFGDVLDGITYATKVIYDGDFCTPLEAKKIADDKYQKSIIAQVFGRRWSPPHKEASFLREHWRLLECTEKWDSLPLIFDNRDYGREAKLLKEYLPKTDLPVVLTNWYGISGPFAEWPRMKEHVEKCCFGKAVILDLTQLKAERIYDLLAFYERAHLLVTVDTATLHLARAGRLPVIQFVRAGYVGAERIRNAVFYSPYDVAFDYLDEISAQIKLAIEKPKLFTVHGRFDTSSGYGQMATDAAMAFYDFGSQVECVPFAGRSSNELPIHINSVMRSHSADPFPILTIDLHHWDKTRWDHFSDGKRVIAQYLYETDKIPDKGVANLNKCELVITPSRWGANVMRRSGVTTPIKVVPLGVDINKYPPSPIQFDPFVFGCAGQLQGGGTRKNILQVVNAFKIAFPHNLNVRLKVKVFPGELPKAIDDERIEFVRERLSHEELVQWLDSLTVFVSSSGGEGWGYWLHQAMCMGRPVISPDFSGETEYFNKRNGYVVEYDLKPADGHYDGQGNFARVKIDSLVGQMQKAYDDKLTLRHKADMALRTARRFSFERYSRGIVNAIVPPTPSYFHTYCVYPNSNKDTKRRNEFALSLWREQYEWGNWIKQPVDDTDLPRLFDDNGRYLPYVKDVINISANKAEPDDVIVYCNTDCCPSPTIARQLIQAMQNHHCAYSYRRDVDKADRFTDAQIRQGQVYAGADLFVMKAWWWQEVMNEFPDFVLGGEAWDWCMRELMDECGGEKFKYLIYHEKHTPRWRATPELRETLPCQILDRRLASEFLHERGIIPNWEPSGERNLNPI